MRERNYKEELEQIKKDINRMINIAFKLGEGYGYQVAKKIVQEVNKK